MFRELKSQSTSLTYSAESRANTACVGSASKIARASDTGSARYRPATVGESENSLHAKDLPYEIGRASFRLNARGQILGDTDGFVKIIFHPEDKRVLGVTIVGETACELIHVGMTVIAYGGTIDYFIQAAFNYPSLADAYKYAAYDGLQRLQKRHSRMAGLPSIKTVAVRD